MMGTTILNMWGTLPASGFYVKHARNVTFENVTVRTAKPDKRPEILREDAF